MCPPNSGDSSLPDTLRSIRTRYFEKPSSPFEQLPGTLKQLLMPSIQRLLRMNGTFASAFTFSLLREAGCPNVAEVAFKRFAAVDLVEPAQPRRHIVNS